MVEMNGLMGWKLTCERCESEEAEVEFRLDNLQGRDALDGGLKRLVCSGCADDMFTEFDKLRRGSNGKLNQDIANAKKKKAGSFKDAEFDNPEDYSGTIDEMGNSRPHGSTHEENM